MRTWSTRKCAGSDSQKPSAMPQPHGPRRPPGSPQSKQSHPQPRGHEGKPQDEDMAVFSITYCGSLGICRGAPRRWLP